ncbi:MAG: hypothetical protein Fur0028_03180 [Bacteroidales bacterium]
MRKLAAHYIFDGNDFIKNGMLTLTDDGEVISLSEFNPNKESANLEFINGIICPGFINAHCHLELSWLKGKLNHGGGMESFIEQMKSIERTNDEKKIEQAFLADYEMWNEGVAACADIVNSSLTLEVKKKSRIYYHNFIELYSLDENQAEQVFNNGVRLYNKFNGFSRSITYHAPYSVSYTLHQKISDFNNADANVISVHSFEAKNEAKLFQQWQSGKWRNIQNPTLYFLKQIPPENNVLFVHNTFINEVSFNELIAYFNQRAWVLCPSSNLFIENTLPLLLLLSNDKKNICIGTDSYASNNRLSILNEIRLLSKYYPNVEIKDWLRIATYHGATALKIQDKFGSFTVGTKPGIIALMDVDLLHLKLTDDTYIKRLV